jgi:hypothetical protein
MNRKGLKPEKLIEINESNPLNDKPVNDYGNVVGQDSLTRFDKPHDENRKNRRPNKRRSRPGQPGSFNRPDQPNRNRNPNQGNNPRGGDRRPTRPGNPNQEK